MSLKPNVWQQESNKIHKLQQDHIKGLELLLRETVMRAHFAMPETEQDEKWFDDPTVSPEFVRRVFDTLKLGQR